MYIPLSDGATAGGGTQSMFNPSRIQPLAGKAINELPVVYLDLFKTLEIISNAESDYMCNLVAQYTPSIIYEWESNFNPHDIYKIVRFLANIPTTSEYKFDFAQIIAYLKLYMESSTDAKDSATYRQRTISSDFDVVSDMPEWFLNLRQVIASTIDCASDTPEVDYWIQREGKFIIRLLSLLIDNDRKNIGVIVIKEDPYL